jgi:two-component system KDP operon response regulator KdpE
MVKPFRLHEFHARIRAQLRRASQTKRPLEEPRQLSSKDHYISLYRANRHAYIGGRPVHLTATEFALLWHLMLHAGAVLSHAVLLHEIRGPEYNDETYLRTYVRLIRIKIEEEPTHPRYLLTASGVGYVFRS